MASWTRGLHKGRHHSSEGGVGVEQGHKRSSTKDKAQHKEGEHVKAQACMCPGKGVGAFFAPADKACYHILKEPKGAEDGAVHPAKEQGHKHKAQHHPEIQGQQGRHKLDSGKKAQMGLY